MYSLTYKVTTSTCDSEGKLKLYSALQMMQDCSEMWIDSEPEVKNVRMAMELLPENFVVNGLRVEYRVAAKLGEMLVPTIYRHDNVIIISLSISEDISAIIEFSSYF